MSHTSSPLCLSNRVLTERSIPSEEFSPSEKEVDRLMVGVRRVNGAVLVRVMVEGEIMTESESACFLRIKRGRRCNGSTSSSVRSFLSFSS